MMNFNLTAGLTATKSEQATEHNTAKAYGSGGVAVYATPAMIGLMEGAGIAAVDLLLPPGFGTVGTSLAVEHLAATPPGLTVTARAELIAVEGRKLVFKVAAFDPRGKIGEGTHERFIVDIEKFLTKAAAG
jgi:predicted thioesterase